MKFEAFPPIFPSENQPSSPDLLVKIFKNPREYFLTVYENPDFVHAAFNWGLTLYGNGKEKNIHSVPCVFVDLMDFINRPSGRNLSKDTLTAMSDTLAIHPEYLFLVPNLPLTPRLHAQHWSLDSVGQTSVVAEDDLLFSINHLKNLGVTIDDSASENEIVESLTVQYKDEINQIFQLFGIRVNHTYEHALAITEKIRLLRSDTLLARVGFFILATVYQYLYQLMPDCLSIVKKTIARTSVTINSLGLIIGDKVGKNERHNHVSQHDKGDSVSLNWPFKVYETSVNYAVPHDFDYYVMVGIHEYMHSVLNYLANYPQLLSPEHLHRRDDITKAEIVQMLAPYPPASLYSALGECFSMQAEQAFYDYYSTIQIPSEASHNIQKRRIEDQQKLNQFVDIVVPTDENIALVQRNAQIESETQARQYLENATKRNKGLRYREGELLKVELFKTKHLDLNQIQQIVASIQNIVNQVVQTRLQEAGAESIDSLKDLYIPATQQVDMRKIAISYEPDSLYQEIFIAIQHSNILQ